MSTTNRLAAAWIAGMFGNLAIYANGTMPVFVRAVVTVTAITAALITLMPNGREQ